MLAHQIQLVALLMSGEAVQQAEKALRPSTTTAKADATKARQKEDPSPPRNPRSRPGWGVILPLERRATGMLVSRFRFRKGRFHG